MAKIHLVDMPDMDVLSRKKTGTYALIPELLMQVVMYIQEKGIPIAGPPFFICSETSPEAVQHAQETGTAVVEVAWPVNGPVQGSGDIQYRKLAGGKMAHTVHKGPYEACEPAYLALFDWIREKGLTICGPVREVYPNDPREVPPDEILTLIYIPVR